MKYIVPLFRQNTGRVNFRLVNWDSFQAGFRMIMRGERFAGVRWDPWWRERKSGERRKGQQRTIPERRTYDKAGHRLSREGDRVQPLRLVHHRRTNWKRRSESDRRKSASRDRLVGLAAFIRELGKSVLLSDENARLLIRMWAALTTRETYESWKQISGMTPFFKELDWNEKENQEKFTEYAVASFLDLLRPGVIYWKGQSPSRDDMRAVARIARAFVLSLESLAKVSIMSASWNSRKTASRICICSWVVSNGGGVVVDIRIVDIHRVTAYLSIYLTGDKVKHTLKLLPVRARIFTSSHSIRLWPKKEKGCWWLRRVGLGDLYDAAVNPSNVRFEPVEDLKPFKLELLSSFEAPPFQEAIGNRNVIAISVPPPRQTHGPGCASSESVESFQFTVAVET